MTELDNMVAENVMGWTLHPYPEEDSESGVWLHKQEGFSELQWTGYISNAIHGFSGDIHSALEDGGVLTIANVPGKVWKPSVDWDSAEKVIEKMQAWGRTAAGYSCRWKIESSGDRSVGNEWWTASIDRYMGEQVRWKRASSATANTAQEADRNIYRK